MMTDDKRLREMYMANPAWAVKTVTEENAQLTARIAKLEEVLHEIAVAGVPFDDPRIDYVEIQVDKETMAEIRALIGGE
jgi:hypothetical protein